jgi:hypothetical protein
LLLPKILTKICCPCWCQRCQRSPSSCWHRRLVITVSEDDDEAPCMAVLAWVSHCSRWSVGEAPWAEVFARSDVGGAHEVYIYMSQMSLEKRPN